jgi:hypothetical protein
MDCPRPPDSPTGTGSGGLPGFLPGCSFTLLFFHSVRSVHYSIDHDWKFRFFWLINDVLQAVLRPGPVKYSSILMVEQQLRDCALPKGLDTPLHGSPLEGLPDDATTMHLQRFSTLMLRETGEGFADFQGERLFVF